uniref:Uncharacterized protein n=1 Tax=Panagrolaimus davidi TaxID=227884 RepID=A0A914QFR0_9BILA
MDAIKCYGRDQSEIQIGCKTCGFQSLRFADGKETEIQRRCLNTDSMAYDIGDDTETISELDKCFVKHFAKA